MIYDVARALHEGHGLPKALYDDAVKLLGERGLVEIIGLCGYYSMVSMTLNTFEFDYRKWQVPRSLRSESSLYLPCSDAVRDVFLQRCTRWQSRDRLGFPYIAPADISTRIQRCKFNCAAVRAHGKGKQTANADVRQRTQ